MSEAYIQLEQRFAQISHLRGAMSILHWDTSTMMPSGASQIRGEQMAALAETAHEKITDPALSDLLGEAEQQSHKLDEWQTANLREIRRQWRHENALSAGLVSELTRATNESEAFWREARKRNDFKGFIPYQRKVLALVQEVAEAKSAVFGCSPYDALLDAYDPGTTSVQIDTWFDDLAGFLPSFTQQVMEHQTKQNVKPVELQAPVDTQRKLARRFMEILGFDFTHGRFDESAHPFCGGVPGDVRLTTRYNEQALLEGMFGIFHETGHALYEMGLPAAWNGQPVGEARGMSVHESQSLLVEMQLCRSQDFLVFLLPILREALGEKVPEAEKLFRSITRVEPSLIRVNADEVTYPSHIILRYRLEKGMLYGALDIADLPQAWNEGMQELLGIKPDSDANGCMQDIHWPDGAFGYFPTYTMGAMLAAQLFATARAELKDLSTHIRRGDFAPLRHWLQQKLHQWGSRYTTPELVMHATGKPLSTETYKAHMQQRYLS